jgi:hypothetical protein
MALGLKSCSRLIVMARVASTWVFDEIALLFYPERATIEFNPE